MSQTNTLESGGDPLVTPVRFDVLAGGGEVGALMRARDWSATPLGPVAEWPQSLRTAVRILLTSRFAMWMGWGPGLTFLYNDAYARMTLGKKHPWALGRRSDEVWAEIWGDIGPRIASVLATGTSTWDEELLLFLERSGFPEETYHTFSYSPLTDDDGAVVGNLCVVTEETDRVIGERRLASLGDLAAALTSTITEDEALAATARVLGANARDLPFTLTYLFDADGGAVLAGRTGIEAGHAAAPDYVAPGDDAAPWPAAALLARGERRLVDHVDARFDALPTGAWDRPPRQALVAPIAQPGQERPAGFLVVGLNPYRAVDDGYAGFVGLLAGQIASSVANARAYEAERGRAEALASLDRAKTAFFSNVSHEFRTPLALMLGPAEDALADPGTVPRNRERLEVIHRNALRLLKLVNSLLDFSRIEAGRVEAVYEPTSLAGYTGELASSFRSAVERAGLRLVVDAAPLPQPVHVDHAMWEKVILNLLSNAFKHTFDGEIAVRVRDGGDAAIVEVSDTGIGIAPDQLARIFERFHRVPNVRSRTHEGTGIGLALVQELVRLHGATIDVRSAEASGTTFTIAVPYGTAHLPSGHVSGVGARGATPLASAVAPYVEEALRWLPDAAETTRSGEWRASSDASTLGARRARGTDGARILLADDNADMRDYVGRLLRDQGWTVEAVADGGQALAAARAQPPDLVLSDVMMPVLDGFGLLRALRAAAETSTIPTILLSARAGEEARVEGLEAGADDYLIKPFSARELTAKVGAALELARVRQSANAAVAAARDLLVRVLEQAPVAICVLRGPTHVFEMANASYQRMVGGRLLVGRPVAEVVPESVGQGFVSLLDEVYRTGRPHVARSIRLVFDRMGEGTLDEAFFNLLYYPFAEPDGTVSGVIAVHTEITDEVRARRDADVARAEAESARETAEAANRAKSDFLAAMSHELRTPLNAIAGYAQLMDMGLHGPVTGAQHEAIERIQRSQQVLLSLINDVLNFAKVEAGRVEYHVDDVTLADVVASTVPMIEPQLVTKRIGWDVRVPPGLVVRADREKLEQILLNLLSNAVKFTEAGGHVAIDGASLGTGVALRVMDTGTGIPAEKLEAIFEPFVQVHTGLTSARTGTGLGLAISRDLARGMRGELSVESTPGQGSIFTLVLPAGSAY